MSDESPSMTDKSKLANGYRQGVITAITVLLTASFLYFRFIAFDPDSGDWTFWGAVCAILAGISICIQLLALWRALQPEDEQVSIYRVTLRWLAAGVLLLVGSYVANIVAVLVYREEENAQPREGASLHQGMAQSLTSGTNNPYGMLSRK
jgi:4-amino-4-deoxy-L-arabinose transferase-like glycosyltransferase